MMEELMAETERLRGVISLLGVGEVKCDKCGKTIRYLDRHCVSTLECAICGEKFNNISELDIHFSHKHPQETPRGARYCRDCSFKAGYLRMVKNKKTGEIFPAMFVLRDEEETSTQPDVKTEDRPETRTKRKQK